MAEKNFSIYQILLPDFGNFPSLYPSIKTAFSTLFVYCFLSIFLDLFPLAGVVYGGVFTHFFVDFYEDFPTHFMAEDDVTSESSVADLSQFIAKMPALPSMCHIISVGKLVESELYCIAHAYLLNLACEMKTILVLFYRAFEKVVVFRRSRKQTDGGGSVEGAMLPMDQCLALRLPPANPFDNFLRAARLPMPYLGRD
ncbi:hypothetical protein ACSBR2_003889 [Camellia fascicularis]